MASILKKSVQEEFLGRTDYNRFTKKPSLALALNAQIASGFNDGTLNVVADLLDYKSAEDEGPKLSVFELQQEFPTVAWHEPATRGLAEKIVKRKDFQNTLQSTIDENQKGTTSTLLGMGAYVASAGITSPEILIPPLAGRVATSTLARAALKNAPRFISMSAAQSASWTRRAQALQKQKFLAGFTEDAAITALITENLFQNREQMLQNPRGVEEYFVNIAASGVFSGAANSVLGRFVDGATASQHIHDRSVQLFNMWTGQTTDMPDPVFRRMAKVESQMAEGFDDANLPSDFNGRVRVFYKKESDFTVGFDETTGDFIVNAAKTSTPKKLKSSLENPQIVASLKDGSFNFKTSKNRFGGRLNKIKKVENLKVPNTELNSQGFSLIDPSAPRTSPTPEVPDRIAPGIEYDPAKVSQVYVRQREEIQDDLGDFDGLSPEEAARVRILNELPEGTELPSNIMLLSSDYKKFFRTGEYDLSTLLIDKRFDREMSLSKFIAPDRKVVEETNKLLDELAESGSLNAKAKKDLSADPTKSKVIFTDEELSDAVKNSEVFPFLNKQRNFAIKELRSVEGVYSRFFYEDNDKSAILNFFSDANKDQGDLAIRNLFKELGIHRNDFLELRRILDNAGKQYESAELKFIEKSQNIEFKVFEELNRQVFIKAQRDFHAARAISEWGGYARAGRAELAGRLDGSLVSGGSYFEGQGNNVFNLMESYRGQYAHTFKGVLARNGVEKFFDNYDDKAREFWTEVSKALDSSESSTNFPVEVKEVADTVALILESQRNKLNEFGAGIRKLSGFLFTTVHNRDVITKNKSAWNSFFLEDGNIDWDRTIEPNATSKQKQDFADAFYKDIDEGFVNDAEIDFETQGGRKGQAFARSRAIHFQQGKQVAYNDKFGNATTAQTILDQIELKAKAIAITERLGPDTKETWKAISKNFKGDEGELKRLENHFNEITGESNIVVNQDLANFSNGMSNLVSAIVNQGAGVTIGVSDLATQFVAMYASGLSPSMGRSLRYVKDSYMPALRSLLGNKDNEVMEALKRTILPYDSNIQNIRKLMGDTSLVRQDNTLERLNLNVIKYSGTGFFTKLSQLASTSAAQRAMLDALKSGKVDKLLSNTLKRFNITEKQFLALAKDSEALIGDQLSVFHIKNRTTKRKLQNLLIEQMRFGSLAADPKQGADVKMGLRPGTFLGTAARQVGLFMPSALAMHQKVLRRLAIMSGGDARAMELFKRGRRVEMAVVTGILLGSAMGIVTIKDILSGREPFWAGDKPLDPTHMWRVLKVSGIAPLLTETKDIVTGGMAGQMFRDALEFGETVNEGSFVDVLANAKEFSPIPWTNFGPAEPMFDVAVGFVSEEYLRDTTRRHLMFEKYTGQGRLFD